MTSKLDDTIIRTSHELIERSRQLLKETEALLRPEDRNGQAPAEAEKAAGRSPARRGSSRLT